VTAVDLTSRAMTVGDLPKAADCAREFYASSKFLRRFDIDRFSSAWTGFIESGAGVIFGLFDEEGNLQGALGGICFPDLYSGELQASEFFWFVKEEHRGRGLDLLRSFEEWARAMGCACIRLAHLMDSMPDRLERVYERRGYVLAEKQYVKELA